MGAAAAANATAVINAQQAAKATGGQRTVQTEVDVTKLHFREVAGEKWVDPSLSEWPDSAPARPCAGTLFFRTT